jgi:polyisoprenoid-binding protein YceI
LPLVALALAVVGTLASSAARAAEYKVDPARSTLLLRIWKEGAASVFAHDHVARATRFTGTVRYDPAKPDASSVVVEAESASLVMDEPNYRRRFDLPPIKEVNRREIQKTMQGAKQLDTATYPAISFRSHRVDGVGPGQLRITGELSLHGKSHEVTFPATVERRGAYLHAKASFRFRQTDFGITPYSFGSAVRNGDEVEMQVELLAE